MHSATACSTNKAKWMEAVDRSYKALLDCAEDVATCEEVEKILDEATIDFQQFLVSFNARCAVSSSGEIAENGDKAKMAAVDIRIDA